MRLPSKIIALHFCVLSALSEKCTTPLNKEGECVPITSCPTLHDALKSLQLEAFEFVKKSQCRHETQLLFCCASSATSTMRATAQNKMALLPSRRYCGYQRFDDYFHTENNGSLPSIDEFPWLAALVYDDKRGNRAVKCSGSLISNRYVLTVAHCVNPPNHTLAGVRLGEHSFKQVEDCVRNGRFEDECADPIEDFRVEERVVHPGYGVNTMNCLDHDIGLLRLEKVVRYSDFIRPICLPFPGTRFARIGDTLYQSGWGISASTRTFTGIKKKIVLELLPNEPCINEYSKYCNITDYQTCTVEPPRSEQLSAVGDAGGPVMFLHRNQWHQEGVTSFGARFNTGSMPGVNAKVVRYLDWILESIQP